MEKSNLEIIKALVIDILKKINKIIPSDCKENFNNNSRSIGITFDSELLDLHRAKNPYGLSTALYIIKDNRIYFEKLVLNKIKEGDESFLYTFYNNLIHELLHMASSNYDPNNKVYSSGFDEEPSMEETHTNSGITEGMTELLRKNINPKADIESSDYYVLTLITYQLNELIGLDIMVRSYFKNLGTKHLKDKLNSYNLDSNLSNILFEQIENYFYLRNKKEGTLVLGYVQEILIEYFIKKTNMELNNSVPYDEVINNISNFEKSLVTEYVLESMQKDSSEYQGLSEALAKFYVFKESVLDKEIAI